MRQTWATTLVVLLLFASGCKHARSSSVANLSDAEFRYGVAPARNGNVVYRDDVVIVGGGAGSIHSLSGDGVTWTIDAHAPRAAELRPGSVMLLTNFAVGRVLKLERASNDDLSVLLGPVELTDVIKEAHVQIDEPVDSNSVIAYYAPNSPGAVFDPRRPRAAAQLQPGTTVTPVSFEPTATDAATAATWAPVRLLDPAPLGTGPAMPSPVTAPNMPVLLNEGFKTQTICCGDLGLRLVYDKNGILVIAKATLLFNAPHITAKFDVTDSRVTNAYLELGGAAGLSWDFEAGSKVGVDGNVQQDYWVPVHFAIPGVAKALGVPVVPAFQFGFLVHTGFSARNSTVHASGSYAFNGSIKAGFVNGSWSASAPTELTIKQSMPDSVGGASISPAGIIMAFKVRLIVGIGLLNFVAGPYVSYISGIGVVHSVSPYCRGTSFDGELHAGVGYSLPKPAVEFVNFFLRALKLNQISEVGGADFKRFPLWSKSADFPLHCAYASSQTPQ